MKRVVILGILLSVLFAGIVSSSSISVGFSVGSIETGAESQVQSVGFNPGIYLVVIFAAVFGFMMFKMKSKSKPSKKKKSSKKKKKSKK